MQQAKNYKVLMQKVGLFGLLDYCLLGVLVVLNTYISLNNHELLAKLKQFAEYINITNVIIVGAIFVVLFNFIINYNILRVLFKLSGDVLTWQEVFFIYVSSSLFLSFMNYGIKLFFKLSHVETAIWLNFLFGICIVICSNIFVWYKKKKHHIRRHLIRRLNVLLIIYAILNVVFVVLGVMNNDV